MARYGKEFKQEAVSAMVAAREQLSGKDFSAVLRSRRDTLAHWRAQALSEPERERTWTAEARLEALIATASLDESARSAWVAS